MFTELFYFKSPRWTSNLYFLSNINPFFVLFARTKYLLFSTDHGGLGCCHFFHDHGLMFSSPSKYHNQCVHDILVIEKLNHLSNTLNPDIDRPGSIGFYLLFILNKYFIYSDLDSSRFQVVTTVMAIPFLFSGEMTLAISSRNSMLSARLELCRAYILALYPNGFLD